MASTVTIKAYVCKQDFGLEDDSYVIYNTANSADRWNLLVGPVEVQYEIPEDFNPKAAKLAALMQDREAAAREFAKTVAKLDKQIAELQAIEYTEAV